MLHFLQYRGYMNQRISNNTSFRENYTVTVLKCNELVRTTGVDVGVTSARGTVEGCEVQWQPVEPVRGRGCHWGDHPHEGRYSLVYKMGEIMCGIC